MRSKQKNKLTQTTLLSKKSTTSATSSGLPNRPNGIKSMVFFKFTSVTISVSINPGATALTLILKEATYIQMYHHPITKLGTIFIKNTPLPIYY